MTSKQEEAFEQLRCARKGCVNGQIKLDYASLPRHLKQCTVLKWSLNVKKTVPKKSLYCVMELAREDASGVTRSSRSGVEYVQVDVATPNGVERLWVEDNGYVELAMTNTLPWRKADALEEKEWKKLYEFKL